MKIVIEAYTYTYTHTHTHTHTSRSYTLIILSCEEEINPPWGASARIEGGRGRRDKIQCSASAMVSTHSYLWSMRSHLGVCVCVCVCVC